MKHLISFIIISACFFILCFSQVPKSFKYQAVARDTNGSILGSKDISIRIIIHEGATDGPEVYTETHQCQTNKFGLINLNIGGGLTGDLFADINWNKGIFFVEIEMDPNGGSDYEDMGISQLQSVPYALFAEEVSHSADSSYWIRKGDDIYYNEGFVGIGTENPYSALHIMDGDLLMSSSNEKEIRMVNSGIPGNPAFKMGRIIIAGDGSPELRFLFASDSVTERSVFEFDEKGIVASVKPDIDSLARGSHFEGFRAGDEQPYFRLNSYPEMKLEMGAGGNKKPDVAIERSSDKAITFYTNSTEQVTIDSLGNLGIHKSKPDYELDLIGDLGITGNYFKNGKPIFIITPDDSITIQQAINLLPPEGGSVFLKAGEYDLSQGIHINRSNVSLKGEPGVILKLENDVNQPVILVGTDKEIPSTGDTTENVQILNLEIDGNKANQSSEIDQERDWIRNNGIDVRMVKNLWIENLNVHDTRSGGIVASWHSRNVFIDNSILQNNFFDGIALYTSENIQVSNFICYKNDAAGLSLDNDLKDVIFSNGTIKNNGDVGIFARHSADLQFNNLLLKSNKSHGCFISHDDVSPSTTGVKRLFFSSCSFINNAGHGLYFGSTGANSPNNTVIGCLFIGNSSGCIYDSSGDINNAANICP